MVAYALETDVVLLPYVPELLADLEELGSDAEVIAEVIDALELPDDAQVIDLGCGKGATALEVVLGVAMKTLSNYANHLLDTPTDAAFADERWQRAVESTASAA